MVSKGPAIEPYHALWSQILATVVLAAKILLNARSMMLSILAIATMLLMISADNFLTSLDIALGSFLDASRVRATS